MARRFGLVGVALVTSAGLLVGVPSPATAVAAPKATSPAALSAPYVAVPNHVLLARTAKARTVVTVAVLGVAGVPADAAAVVLTVAVAKPSKAGSLVLFPYGHKRPGAVSLAFSAKHSASAVVVVAPGQGGKVSLYTSSTTSVKGTVTGYYATPGGAGGTAATRAFVPVGPQRAASLLAKPGTTLAVRPRVPSTGVAGVVLSVTVAAPATTGSVAVSSYGATTPAATLSFTSGHPLTRLLLVRPDAKGRIALVSHGRAAVRVWVDLVGYLQTLLVPGGPTSVAATASSGRADVTWQPPASDGGSPVAGYTVTTLPAGPAVLVDGATLRTTITGLQNGNAYFFSVAAVNSVGAGSATVSASVLPFGPPGAPTAVTAVLTGAGSATVSWTAPADTGGFPIASYQVTTSPGGTVTSVVGTSAVIAGLSAGQVYTFGVSAVTARASSPAPANSNPVVGLGTSRASVSNGGTEGDAASTETSVSSDGRYVAFTSAADNLTGNDGSTQPDVFVRDRLLDTTTLVSVDTTGQHGGDGDSGQPSISANGRYVAFTSSSTDLVTPATDGTQQVFLRDLVSGTTTLLSQSAGGVHANGISLYPAISADGSSVAFTSVASNLVTGDDNMQPDVFEVSTTTHAIQRVSVSSSGTEGDNESLLPAVSADGRYVTFASYASNLVAAGLSVSKEQVYRHDALTGATELVSWSVGDHGADGNSEASSLSADGRYVAFSSVADNVVLGDTNAVSDVFVRDLQTETTTRVSVDSHGGQLDLVSLSPAISADGHYVSYLSGSIVTLPFTGTFYVPEVFRYDRAASVDLSVSSPVGLLPTSGTYVALFAISGDGQHVAFSSADAGLVPHDLNSANDVFVADLG